IDSGNEKWDVQPWSLLDLKNILSKWQYALESDGWNSLYWNNHDQPRIVSRFGNDQEYREKSAKMLATTLHMMKGTPYIYQGEEFGMTNVKFPSIDEYRDIETLNMYKEKIANGEDKTGIMNSIYIKSRDNARTPIQWDDSEYAGFSTVTPWIGINPNYKEINAKSAIKDFNSIFHYYKQLIKLRKEYPIIIEGKYQLISPKNEEVFAYTRVLNREKLFVISNFMSHSVTFDIPQDLSNKRTTILISNTDEDIDIIPNMMTLSPYDTYVFHLQ